MTTSNGPHPEERPRGASRRTHAIGTATTAFLIAATLLLGACAAEGPHYPPARKPLGVREPLRTGHWRGPINQTEVDFYIDQVTATTVAIHVSGTVLRQANKSLETSGVQNYFYDRPRSCKIIADGRSFDCTRYTDMHIDNGLLCGVYAAPDQIVRPCLEPAR